MSWDSNPYFSPEKFRLQTVGEIEWRDDPYAFDLTVLWKDEQSRYFLDSDSGCSCPTPFEDTNLSELKPMTAHEVAAELAKIRAEKLAEGWYDEERFQGPFVDLIAKVMLP